MQTIARELSVSVATISAIWAGIQETRPDAVPGAAPGALRPVVTAIFYKTATELDTILEAMHGTDFYLRYRTLFVFAKAAEEELQRVRDELKRIRSASLFSILAVHACRFASRIRGNAK